jgi:AcrR family transcriptional regulator
MDGSQGDREMKAPNRARGRPRKDIDRADARDELLDAAHALMSERGGIDVPVLDIAQRAGLNVALVNYYFGGKDGLLLELALRHQHHFAGALRRLMAFPDSAEAKLVLHIRGLVRAFRKVPYLQRLLHNVLRDSTEEAARASGENLIRPLADFYAELVEQGVAEGTFRRVDPMHLYVALGGAADFLFSGSASLKYGFGVEAVTDKIAEDYAEYLIALVRRGLLATS